MQGGISFVLGLRHIESCEGAAIETAVPQYDSHGAIIVHDSRLLYHVASRARNEDPT